MYYVVYGFFYVFSLLPLRVLYLFSDFAFFILYRVKGYRKQVVMDNLAIAFPEKSIEERKKIAKDFYLNYTDSTIGEEKKFNYALKAASKAEFIEAVTDGITPPPQYFPINAKINKEGYDSLDEVLEIALRPLSVLDFKKQLNAEENTVILDTRNSAEFTAGFVPGSVSIGLDGRFAEWAGSLLPFDVPMLLIAEPGKEKESIIRLARVGLDKVKGYLQGGYSSWKKSGEPTDMIVDIEADELMMDIPFDENLVVVDVRKPAEYADGHLKEALNIPLNDLTDPGNMANLEDHHNIYIHCAGGYRSVIAASLLKRQGFHNLRNVLGGWSKIKEQDKAQVVKEADMLN